MTSVLVDRHDAIATVTLNRPAKRNALTIEMLRALATELERLADDPGVRVVVLRGAGPAFCVGADVQAFAANDANSARRTWVAVGHRVTGLLADLPQPTIAAIHGHALGGGLEIALACDLRIATSQAKLGLPEVGLGTLPGWGGTRRLANAVGPVRAKAMVLMSEVVDGGQAQGMGLVTDSCEESELEARVSSVSQALAAQPAVAVQLAKQVMNATNAPSHMLQTYEALAGALSVTTSDLREGIAAFAEKREPRFEGSK